MVFFLAVESEHLSNDEQDLHSAEFQYGPERRNEHGGGQSASQSSSSTTTTTTTAKYGPVQSDEYRKQG
jgi:hypothetical protein